MRQKGAMTLLTTALLLSVTLLLVLGSYKTTFHQIKIAQNELKARQAHWRVEGGLECGYAHIVQNSLGSIPNTLNSDCSMVGLTNLSVSGADPDVLVAQLGTTQVSKAIQFASGGANGAIKSTSNLVVFGSTLVSPPDPGELNADNKYECATAVVSKYLIATGVKNDGVGTGIPKPSNGFDNSYDCDPNHQTISSIQSGIWENATGEFVKFNVLEDFQRIKDLNPFKDKFGYERSQWKQAQADPNFGFKSYKMTAGNVDCVSKFIGDLDLGQPNAIWIEGSCELDVDAIKNVQSANAGTYLFLMMHNGVVGINGSGTIEGVMFHFNNGFAPAVTNWDKFVDPQISAILYNSGGQTNFDTMLQTIYGYPVDARLATYLQSGAFKFTGGMMFDTQGQIALFNNSMSLQYNSDITDSFGFTTPPRWKRGSWNDF